MLGGSDFFVFSHIEVIKYLQESYICINVKKLTFVFRKRSL